MLNLTGLSKTLIGMVHVRALPGTPRHSLSMREICDIAADEATKLEQVGFDAVLVENMHDVPFLNRAVGPEIVASMTAAVLAVRRAVSCPVGVQVLAGANKDALAVAHAAGAQFIRSEGFVFSHIADEGLMDSDAGELLRFRRAIGASDIRILVDIKKKHASHALTGDLDLSDTAHGAEFFGADALIITGGATGRPTLRSDLDIAARGSRLPLLVGSGTTPDTLRELWHAAQGFIIGSYLKRDGRWHEQLDMTRATRLIQTAAELRKTAPMDVAAPVSEIY